MYRWSVCPGSVRECRGQENKSSEFARLGTAAHALGEHCLKNEQSPAEWLGKTVDADLEAPILVDEDMIEAVQVYIDTVRHVWADAKASLTTGSVLIEHRFDLSKVYPGLFGTCDAIVYDAARKRLTVIDYKHGQGVPVDVKANPQLTYYALGALMSAPAGWKIDEVVLCVVQPRCHHADGPVRTFSMPAYELMEFAVDLAEYAEATQKPDAPLVAGDHCRFCPAAAKCPLLQQRATEAFQTALIDAAPTADIDEDGEYFGKWLPNLEVLEVFIKAVREAAYAHAAAGKAVPGWKLVAKESRRQWDSPEQVVAYLKSKKVPETEMYKPVELELKTPAQMEKLEPFKGKANAEAKKELQALAVKKSTGTVLVPEADSRPAYSAAEDFETVQTTNQVGE